MITIIITALASVFITLVVGYFIWLNIRVRKLKKQVEDNLSEIAQLKKDDEDIRQTISFNQEEINEKVNNNFDEFIKLVTVNQNEIDTKVNNNLDEVYSRINNDDEELHRELDKRFDKVYQSFKDKA